MNCVFAAKTMTNAMQAKVFFLKYRLASSPGGRVHAALQDVVTAYQHLLDLGISSSAIILSGIEASDNYATDFIPPSYLSWGVRAYTPSLLPLSHPYLSPGLHPTSAGVLVWIQVSGREVFRDDCIRYLNALQQSAGTDVEFCEISEAPHKVILTAGLVGRENYAKQAAEKAAKFLKTRHLL
ncbi:MAG: hypothetical protein Q9188_005531 [Gyalolechia gomerana]